MTNVKCVFALIFAVIKMTQICMMYSLIIGHLKSESTEYKVSLILLLGYYFCVTMVPFMMCNLRTAVKWQMGFSIPTLVFHFGYATFMKFYSSDGQENENSLDEEEHKDLQNFTTHKETNTAENKDEVSSKLLLEIFTFILEILLLLLSLLAFDKRQENLNPEEIPLEEIANVNDVEAGIGNENQANVAFEGHEAADEPIVAEPVLAVEPIVAEPVLAVEPIVAEPVLAVELAPTIEPAAVIEPSSASAVESTGIDGIPPPDEEEVGSMSQESALETSTICRAYRRMPYHIHIEDEDDMEEKAF